MKVFGLLLSLVMISCTPIQGSGLIGGSEVQPGEYPEVVRIRSGNSMCTASLISARVLLTAAHCTKENGDVVTLEENSDYEFLVEHTVYKARCKIAPHYNPTNTVGSQDFALCKTDKPVAVKFAVVSKEAPKVGETVTLIGYGCIRSDYPRGGNDGILRVGEATVARESTPDYYHWHTIGKTTLCSGDSGGPAFKRVINPKKDVHYVAGVNSMGDLKELALLTSLQHSESVKFMRAFEKSEGVGICGISLDCQGDDPKEDPNPKPCGSELDDLKKSVQELEACMAL